MWSVPDLLKSPLLRSRAVRFLLGTLAILLLVQFLWWLGLRVAPPPDPYAVRPAGVRVLDREGRLVRGFLSEDEKWRWRLELDEISPQLLQAVLHHEDRHFHRHHGVDGTAVLRAAWSNLRAGRVVSGASTITMQLARLVEPRPRTMMAKFHQMLRAWQYESLYSKDQILEMYLNLAPYGGNVEGVGPAARVLFAKAAAELSPAEACLLAVLPQSPTRHDPLRHPAAARKARNHLARRLAAAGHLDQANLESVLSSPLPSRRWPVPFSAPHFSRWTSNRHPGKHNLRTTLDLNLQKQVQKLVRLHGRRVRPLGIEQAAAVVLDVASGQILAMVGSVDFNEDGFQGQVNGAVAPRSPGSTLKPLVYAMAFDQGLTTPDAMVQDVPLHFGDYSPKNFDGRFAGMVRCGSALQRSLNVPAVELASRLEQTRTGGLHRFLRRAGVSSLPHEAHHYGLSLVLGGGEINLLELASLYGLLGRHGRWLPLRDLIPEEAETPGLPLLGRGACWLTLEELQGLQRPDPERVWQTRLGGQTVAWKTGTSYGHRDAWSVGLVGSHVLAVWVGNFDGHGCPHLTGAGAAAPLFFDLVDGLGRSGGEAWPTRPPGVRTRQVCSLSGHPPAAGCPHTTSAHFLPGISPAGECRIHRSIQVDAESGHAVCSRCRQDRATESLVVEWWPPRVATYLATGNLEARQIPEHNPDCPAFGRGESPVITSPQNGRQYILRPGIPLEDQALALTAEVSTASHQVYWFVDGELVDEGSPTDRFFYLPSTGRHTVTVLDEAGRSSAVSVWIKDERGQGLKP
jgi:penicillin-binding protein 1C